MVGDRYVITSAFCTEDKLPNEISVLVGDTTLGVANDTSRFFLNVSEIRKHLEYDKYLMNNIAVLVLSPPLDLKAYPNIKPACLPTSETKTALKFREAVTSGWGTLDENSNSNLHKLGVKILPNCSAWQG